MGAKMRGGRRARESAVEPVFEEAATVLGDPATLTMPDPEHSVRPFGISGRHTRGRGDPSALRVFLPDPLANADQRQEPAPSPALCATAHGSQYGGLVFWPGAW